MRILVLQHLEIEPPALIADLIRNAGHSIETIRIWQGETIPHRLNGLDGIIVMGGPQSANDMHLGYIRDEIALLEKAIKTDFPVLGICLGAQLLARAAGAAITASPVRELGWLPIYPTKASKSDPLFRHMQDEQMAFQWHGETFSLPEHASLLVTHPAVPQQAFRIGSSQYGLQFHFEVDPALIQQWVDAGESEREYLGRKDLTEMRNATEIHLPCMHRFCAQTVHAWLGLIKKR
ncbi:MAG: type 1 glutamine amidotransferase [Mariprofundaceae bacterium]